MKTAAHFSAIANTRNDAGQDRLDKAIELLEQLAIAVGEMREELAGRSKSHYTVEEFAKLTGRAPYTVRNWIRVGLIVATRVQSTGPNGRLLIPREELLKIVNWGHGAKLQGALFNETFAS